MLNSSDLSKLPSEEAQAEPVADRVHPLNKRLVRFGPFELRTDTGELKKFGIRIKLQGKPAQILEMLVSRRGELVRREELCERLWSSGIFVDFESGLNTAVNRLRAALGDNSDSPHYIETIPRLGYRFICPVQEVTAEILRADSANSADRVCMPVSSDVERLSAPVERAMDWRLAWATILALVCQGLFVFLAFR